MVESRLKSIPAAASATNPLLPEPSNTTHTVNVDVDFHHGVAVTHELIHAVADATHLDEETLVADEDKISLTVQRRYLSDLAALDQVKSIHQVHARKLHNNVARTILRSDQAVDPVQNTPYGGEGQVICVADTGFDKGSMKPSDVPAAFKTTNGVRVRHLYPLGRPSSTADTDGHGTHVCGSVLGDDTSAVTGERVQGTAPKATLVMQSLLDSRGGLGGIPKDLRTLFRVPYTEHGARIHTNSWGSAPEPFYQIKYNDESREIDDFVVKNRDMVILFAAGNDGMDTAPADGVNDRAQIGSQAAAKNCISVGASESIRDSINVKYQRFGYPKAPISTDKVASNAHGMAAFSSRGPTAEGRVKPDVVAPGTCILSTLSARARDTKSWGASRDPKFMYLGGTSMATPLVAGCCAVIRETLVKNGTPTPSAALIKALLINGAVELTGQYTPTEAGPSPNESSGWGRVDVANSVILPSGEATTESVKTTTDKTSGFRDEDPSAALDTFDEFSVKIPIAISESSSATPKTLKVTLVWTDPAGETLQNDLDLIVVSPDGKTERHGNQRTLEFPVKTKAQRDDEEKATPKDGHAAEPFDRKNNVEQVVWTGLPAGEVTVIVRGHNVSSVEGQTFALVWKLY